MDVKTPHLYGIVVLLFVSVVFNIVIGGLFVFFIYGPSGHSVNEKLYNYSYFSTLLDEEMEIKERSGTVSMSQKLEEDKVIYSEGEIMYIYDSDERDEEYDKVFRCEFSVECCRRDSDTNEELQCTLCLDDVWYEFRAYDNIDCRKRVSSSFQNAFTEEIRNIESRYGKTIVKMDDFPLEMTIEGEGLDFMVIPKLLKVVEMKEKNYGCHVHCKPAAFPEFIERCDKEKLLQSGNYFRPLFDRKVEQCSENSIQGVVKAFSNSEAKTEFLDTNTFCYKSVTLEDRKGTSAGICSYDKASVECKMQFPRGGRIQPYAVTKLKFSAMSKKVYDEEE